MESEILFQAAEYFRGPGFVRLFKGLGERYAALSRLGGRISLKNLSEEEARALEGFLQIEVLKGGSLSVSASQIRKALKKTRFADCSLEELVPLVLNGSIQSNKERKEQSKRESEAFFEEILCRVRGTPAGNWLLEGLAKGHPLNALLVRDYHADREWLKENLPLILDAVNRLPIHSGEYVRLPVFAASITGNPHYFDEGKRSLSYLLYAISGLLGHDTSFERNVQAKAGLLYEGGIIKDDLSNWVLCLGIRGYEAGGGVHPGMEEYVRRGEPQILTLKNLSLLKAVEPVGQRVWVVENPSVFSYLMEQEGPGLTCICSGGQLRLAVLVLLDLLVKNPVTIYYSGDFDPEGLCIAQKLIDRYGKQIKLWRYEEETYQRAVSSEIISERRLKQLDSLRDERLAAIGELLKKRKRAGYQENILDRIL